MSLIAPSCKVDWSVWSQPCFTFCYASALPGAGRDCRLRRAALLGNPGTSHHRRSCGPRVSTGKASGVLMIPEEDLHYLK